MSLTEQEKAAMTTIRITVVWWGTTQAQRVQFIWHPSVGIMPMAGWPRRDRDEYR